MGKLTYYLQLFHSLLLPFPLNDFPIQNARDLASRRIWKPNSCMGLFWQATTRLTNSKAFYFLC